MTTTESTRRVTIEFAPPSAAEASQVTGVVVPAGGAPVAFVGWIALLEQLEAVATATRSTSVVSASP